MEKMGKILKKDVIFLIIIFITGSVFLFFIIDLTYSYFYKPEKYHLIDMIMSISLLFLAITILRREIKIIREKLRDN